MSRALGVLIAAALLMLPGLSRADEAAGVALWKQKCANCHGEDGKAATKMGKRMQVMDMTTAEFQKKVDDAAIRKRIAEGINSEVNGVKKKMDPYKDLKPEQVADLIALIRSWAPKQ